LASLALTPSSADALDDGDDDLGCDAHHQDRPDGILREELK